MPKRKLTGETPKRRHKAFLVVLENVYDLPDGYLEDYIKEAINGWKDNFNPDESIYLRTLKPKVKRYFKV